MSTPEIEAPDFNGMSPEVFHTGNEISNLMQSLSGEQAAELRLRLTREIINQTLSEPTTLNQLDDLSGVFRESLEFLESARHQHELRAKLESMPHTDTDY